MGLILFLYQMGEGCKNKGVSITMKNVLLALVVLALGVLACERQPWPPTNALVVPALVVRHPDRAHFVPGHFSPKIDVSAIVEKPEIMKHLLQKCR